MGPIPFALQPSCTVRDPDGAKWTISIARGNQWPGWRWLNFLEGFGWAGDSAAVSLALGLAAVPPIAARWVSYHLRRRTDWRVTIRQGIHSTDQAVRGAVLNEEHPSKSAAAERAERLVVEVSKEGVGKLVEQIRVSRPEAPILLFDVNDAVYAFSSAEDLEGWYEPMMEEESAACFDSLARVVTVLPAGKGWEARLAGYADEEALRAYTVAFLRLAAPDQLGLAELPLPSMVEAVAALERGVRLRDRRPWKWFGRPGNSGT